MDPELEQKMLILSTEGSLDPLSDKEEEKIQQAIDLSDCERWYRARPNNYRLLVLWDKYRNYREKYPEWLQQKIDSYLLAKLKNERSRYSEGNQKRNLNYIVEIAEAERAAVAKGKNVKNAQRKAIEKIAEREGVSSQAIKIRIKPKKRQ